MFSIPIFRFLGLNRAKRTTALCALNSDTARLPAFVRQSAVAMRYWDLLGSLDWNSVPERCLDRNWGKDPVPFHTFIAACLVKLDQGLTHMSQLRQYLEENPALAWLLGFNPVPNLPLFREPMFQSALPTQRHFARMLRLMPNSILQTLLDSSIIALRTAVADPDFGKVISLDTKHILAWVRENNPKQYVQDRFDKTRQPAGDPDCKLGCKKRHNRRVAPPTPAGNPIPAGQVDIGEFYWGYASGVVVTKIAGQAEVVLAELTQSFDHPDVSYFYPLMAQVERRLGFRPPFGALDAAFDAAYVYEYFAQTGGFAAVPLVDRGGVAKRQFNEDGLPLCQADLPMPLQYTFIDRTHLFERSMGRYRCSLINSQSVCPIQHKNWAKGGCVSTMAMGPGARQRYLLDRESADYKHIYNQRTAVERINSQAVQLGIERPHLRNGQAIANLNTLIYVLINLHTLRRIRHHNPH